MGELWIDRLTFAGALDAIGALVEAGAGGAVFTPNVDHVVLADADPRFREAYAGAELSLVDGKPLLWAARVLGAPLPEKISGSDLILPLMERAAAKGWRVYLLGAGPGVAEEAAAVLQRRCGVQVVGTDSPMVSLEPSPEDEAIAARVQKARPHLVLVAFGAPKQEIWIHRMKPALRPAVALGIGAGLDFIAGKVKRSPKWMSDNGLEWLYRLTREPRRLWRRYLVNDPKFLGILVRAMRTPPGQRTAVRGP